MNSSVLLVVLLCFTALLGGVAAQSVQGIPLEVCGNQTYTTSMTGLSSNVLFAVTSTRPDIVTVGPASVTYGPTGTQNISVSCVDMGAAELVFTSQGTTGITDSVRIYCMGK